MKIGILACSALADYVNAAQEKMKTDYPVVKVDRNYHDRPKLLRTMIEEGLGKFSEEIDTILIAMGACGNCWQDLSCGKKLVIPRMDDCVTILMHTDDRWYPNLKKAGHFYHIDEESTHFSILSMYEGFLEKYGEKKAEILKEMMFGNYTNVDIVDTGVFDCHHEKYVSRIKKDADLIRVPLGFVEGSNHILEKLVSGNWDEQFVIIEPETAIDCRAFIQQEGRL